MEGGQTFGSNGGPGLFGKIGDMFKNPLFLKLLSGAGSDLMQGTGGKNTNDIVQNTIMTKQYYKMLQNFLAGDMSGVKATVDDTGMKLNLAAPQGNGNQTIGGTPSPFDRGQHDISYADVAGLSPELINQALTMKMHQDEVGRMTQNELFDKLYKMASFESGEANRQSEAELRTSEIDVNKAQINKLMNPTIEQLDQPSPITIPNIGQVTNRQFSEMPTEDKSYAIYYTSATNAGKPPMSREEWDKRKPNEHIRELEQLKARPDLLAIEKSLRESSAPRYTPFETKTQTEKAQAQADVMAPDFVAKVSKDLERGSNEDLLLSMEDPNKAAITKRNRLANEMGDRIRRAFGSENVTPVQGGWKVITSNGEKFISGPQK